MCRAQIFERLWCFYCYYGVIQSLVYQPTGTMFNGVAPISIILLEQSQFENQILQRRCFADHQYLGVARKNLNQFCMCLNETLLLFILNNVVLKT